jgi:hypothetical protein
MVRSRRTSDSPASQQDHMIANLLGARDIVVAEIRLEDST